MGGYPRWRRRQWLIDRHQQVPFASVLLVQTTLIVIALGLFAYLVNRRMMSVVLGLVGRGQELISQELYVASQSLLGWLLLSVGLTALVQILFGVYTSHKLAGPVFKMRRILSELASGKTNQRVVFRTGDYLDELAGTLNRVCGRLNEQGTRLRTELPLLSGALDDMRAAADEGRLPADGADLQKLTDSVEQLARLWSESEPPEAG